MAGVCHVEADLSFQGAHLGPKRGICSLFHKKKVHHSVSLNMYIGVNLILKKKNIYIYMSYSNTL